MSFNLPNPSLLGILFVISTHSGPQLVFKYPPDLSSERIQRRIRRRKIKNTPTSLNRHSHHQHTSHRVDEADSSTSDDDFEDEDDYESVDSDEDSNIQEFETENEWDSGHLDYYMGTKKDILTFLDEQERQRKHQSIRSKHSQANINIDSADIAPTAAAEPTKENSHSAPSRSRQSNQNDDQPVNGSKDSDTDFSAFHKLNKTVSGVSQKSSQSRASNGANNNSGSTTSVSNATPDQNNAPSDVLGFEPDYLSEILTPPKEMCNSRFEIMVEDVFFLGLPIHNYEDGSWRSSKSKKAKSNKSQSSRSKPKSEKDAQPDGGTRGEKNGPYGEEADEEDNGAADNDDNDDNNDNDNDNNDDDDGHAKHSMNMFHVVFVMNPPIIECNYRIDEMFHYVISRLSLVLRYEQSKHDYVWNQVKIISKLKEEWTQCKPDRTLTSHLVMKSSLAKLIAECYTAIASSKIANLSINNKLKSFQIPIKTEFHSLPEATVPYLPGSHLSSTVNILGNTGLVNVGETTRYGMSNMMTIMMMGGENPMVPSYQASGNMKSLEDDQDDNEDADEIANADDVIYFALLLLDDPETIIRDIKGESYSPLANFIRMIKPTESLLKLSHKLKSQASSNGSAFILDINQIKSFAFHLIYWRRARIIPPLNTRSVYIVSPMAPITINLYEDITKFKAAFTTLPSLPHFLKLFSTRSRKPKQFASVIPSKDHHDIYLSALEWLIRHGYVTQLHTFIWLKISRKIKMKVEEDLEIEGSKIAKRKRDSDATTDKLNVSNTDNKIIRSSGATDNSSKQVTDEGLSGTSISELKNKEMVSGSLPLASSYDGELETLDKNIRSLSLGPNIALEEDDDTIIIDPGRATTLERRWINKIIQEDCQLSPELTSIFYKLLKYMNGKNSLELLLLKENVSRHDLRKLLFAIEDHIISVRHW